MSYMSFFWLAVAIIAAIVEGIVPALVSIWFVAGGIAALIVSLCGGSMLLQFVLFVAVSALALAVTRPLVRRMQKTAPVPTNADRVIGAEAIVTEEINSLLATGRVSVRGASWAARAEENETIAVGDTVVVRSIEGVKLIVARKKQ